MEPLQPGDLRIVGKYRLLGRLGEGGMGQVFFARSPGGRPVAVKVIRNEYAHRGQFRERFAREVDAARKVGGFHTAMVVDADPGADPPWMATAYIAGPPLHQAITDHGPLDTQAVRMLGAGLAEGLAAIHACGLVHRDLKPANVILAADGPRIIDFGIARTQDAGTMTATGAIVGTYAYMAPEQVNGHPATPASDVFALGAVLAFAATGRSPFDADTVATILHRITSEPPDLSGLADTAQRDLIAACLAKDPAARPQLADVLARLDGPWPEGDWLAPAVMAMIGHQGSDPGAVHSPYTEPTVDPTTPPPSPRRTPRRPSRRVLVIAGTAAVALAAATAITAVTLPDRDADHAPPPRAAGPASPMTQTERPAPIPPTRPAGLITDDGRAFGPGGWSVFEVRVDPANTGVRLTRRLDASVVGQSAWIYVGDVRAGRWAPLEGALAHWADQTVELSPSATTGRRTLVIKNKFDVSTKDFNEFTYSVDELVRGGWHQADVVDVGPEHPVAEKTHHYRIEKKTWQGTRRYSYKPPESAS